MKSKLFYILVASSLVASFGCKEKTPEVPEAVETETVAEATPEPEPEPEAEPEAEPEPAAAEPTELGALANPAELNEQAPDKFSVKFDTTAGEFTVDLTREWAPLGVDRFYNLVKAGYYNDIAAFRVIGGFMAQFGIHGNPEVNAIWREARIQDDPQFKGVSNTKGYLTYATSGPNSRTVQLFINYGNNVNLDGQGFRPIGKVAGDGMKVVEAFNNKNGEKPNQMEIQTKGNSYLRDAFPDLTYINSVTLVEGDSAAAATPKAPSKPAAPAKAWKAGAFQAKDLSSGNIEGANVRITVTDAGKVTGSYQGRREGSAFSIPLIGTIADDGTITAKGERGGNNATLTGRVSGAKFSGALQGEINKNNFRLAVQAE